MVMASAGVNMPGGDGNPAAAAASAGVSPECRLRRRRRLSPPPAATVASGSSDHPSASRRRPRPPSPPPASSPPTSEETESDTEEEGELLPPMAAASSSVLALPTPSPPPAPEQPPAPVPGPVAWPVAFGSMELAGRMREMEDAVSLHPNFHTWVDGTPMHFFAVFDGHGGPHVSALCRNQMHLILSEDLAEEASRFVRRRQQHQHQHGRRRPPATGSSSSSSSAAWQQVEVEEEEEEQEQEEAAWRAALRRAFARVDALAAVACACGTATVPRCTCPLSGITSAIVGSTAVVAVLVGGRIVVANCGDSRAVLCRGPEGAPPVPLSFDHKPDRPDERARIESVGGQVIYINGPRVRGILAMSRALGDRFLRPEVISEPEITITPRTHDDQFLIMASDGMWDAMTNETACSVARQCLEDGGNHPSAGAVRNAAGAVGPNPEHRCEVTAAILARLALGRGSPDNVSIVVVDLQNRGGQ